MTYTTTILHERNSIAQITDINPPKKISVIIPQGGKYFFNTIANIINNIPKKKPTENKNKILNTMISSIFYIVTLIST